MRRSPLDLICGLVMSAVPWAGILFFAGSSWAGTVELTGGGHVASDVVHRRERPDERPYVAAKLDEDLWVKLPASRVARVVDSAELAEYRRRVEIADNDPELHYALARWCKQQSALPLEDQYRYHLRRVISLDPGHSKARAALGYVQYRGEWKKFEEVKRSEGMISVSGKWVVPEAEVLRRQEDEADVASKRWAKEITRLRKMVERGNTDAWATLEALEDPLAAMGIARELADSRGQGSSQNRPLRRLWVQLLGRFKTAVSVEALTLTVLEETDPAIRDMTIEQLKEYGQSSAIATCLPMLKSNDEKIVKAAAAAMADFPPQPGLAMPLIDALVTQHKRVIPPGPGTQVGFSDFGGGGMSTGGKAQVIFRPQQNADVLSMLKAIEPGVDHGYDQSRWRQHFAQKWASYSGDLRRDP